MVCCCGPADMGTLVKRSVAQGVAFLRELAPMQVAPVSAWVPEGGASEDAQVSLGAAIEAGSLWEERGALVYLVRRMG